MRPLPAVLALLLLLVGAACSSTRPQIRPSTPFEPVHARFFDDAADFVRDPVALGGQWANEWDEELRGRVGYADTITRVKIETLRTSTDVEQRLIAFALERVPKGGRLTRA